MTTLTRVTRLTPVTRLNGGDYGDQTNHSHWIEYERGCGRTVKHEKLSIFSFNEWVSQTYNHQCKRASASENQVKSYCIYTSESSATWSTRDKKRTDAIGCTSLLQRPRKIQNSTSNILKGFLRRQDMAEMGNLPISPSVGVLNIWPVLDSDIAFIYNTNILRYLDSLYNIQATPLCCMFGSINFKSNA